MFVCDEAHAAVTAEIEKHADLLEDGQAFEIDLPDHKKEMLESVDKILDAHFVSSREFLLCLTLQKPQSSKFQERLLDYTSQVGGHMKKPWQNCLSEPLAAELQRLMVVKADKKKSKTEKKDKDKKDKKDSSEKKEKKSKDDSKKVRKEDNNKSSFFEI